MILLSSFVSLSVCGGQTNILHGCAEAAVVKEKNGQTIPASELNGAIQVAETELERQYGARVLDQRPWIVSMSNDCYVIKGNPSSLVAKNGKKMKGGLATIVVDKNMKVVRTTHGK